MGEGVLRRVGLLALVTLGATAACGIKGPPRAPLAAVRADAPPVASAAPDAGCCGPSSTPQD